MRFLIVFILVLLALSSLNAQQSSVLSHATFGQLYFNPAYAGSRDALSIMSFYRQQWVGIENAPSTVLLSSHTPISKKHAAIGIWYARDQIGGLTTNQLFAQYAYRLKAGPGKLSIGLSAGFDFINFDPSNLNAFESLDPILVAQTKKLAPNAGFGLYYHDESYYLGLAMPKIFPTEWLTDTLISPFSARNYQQLNTSGAYVFKINEGVKFKPSVMLRYTQNSPMQFDVTTAFLFLDKIWLSVGYRTNDAYIFATEFNLGNQLRLGYAYDLTVSKLSRYSSGSHEIMIGYELFRVKTNLINPRSISYF